VFKTYNLLNMGTAEKFCSAKLQTIETNSETPSVKYDEINEQIKSDGNLPNY